MFEIPEYIKNLKPYKPGKPIDEVKRELNLKEVVKLASNENPFGCSLFVKKAIEKEAVNVNRYPDGGSFYLREELSKFLSVNQDEIVFGNGSNEIIDLIGRAFLREGDEVLSFQYSFVVYRLITQLNGGIFKEVEVENDLSRDLNKMLNAITDKTKIVFIDNPCNPTGFANLKEEFDEFIKKVPENVIVVIDEAYFEYAKEHGVPNGIHYVFPINPEIPKNKNVIVLRTFSKAYGLAGLRIGYGISKKEIIEILEKVRQPFNVNYLAQVGAVEALKDQKFVEFSVFENEKGKEQLYEGLERLGIHFYPTYGNFILFKIQNSDEVYDRLLKNGIIIRPAFGMENHLRVSIGTEEENKKFLEALKFLKNG
jgi:histidinol-phosphate aminotransferase